MAQQHIEREIVDITEQLSVNHPAFGFVSEEGLVAVSRILLPWEKRRANLGRGDIVSTSDFHYLQGALTTMRQFSVMDGLTPEAAILRMQKRLLAPVRSDVLNHRKVIWGAALVTADEYVDRAEPRTTRDTVGLAVAAQGLLDLEFQGVTLNARNLRRLRRVANALQAKSSLFAAGLM